MRRFGARCCKEGVEGFQVLGFFFRMFLEGIFLFFGILDVRFVFRCRCFGLGFVFFLGSFVVVRGAGFGGGLGWCVFCCWFSVDVYLRSYISSVSFGWLRVSSYDLF